MIFTFLGIVAALAVVSCGYDEQKYEVVYPDDEEVPVVFTDEKIRKSCFGAACHNDSAPDIPSVGSGFKESTKVRTRIENGTMPPGGKWNAKTVKAAIEYLNAN